LDTTASGVVSVNCTLTTNFSALSIDRILNIKGKVNVAVVYDKRFAVVTFECLFDLDNGPENVFVCACVFVCDGNIWITAPRMCLCVRVCLYVMVIFEYYHHIQYMNFS